MYAVVGRCVLFVVVKCLSVGVMVCCCRLRLFVVVVVRGCVLFLFDVVADRL